MSVEKLIRAYLDEAKLLQIVSCNKNQPWLAHVWFARDDDLNIYWMSREDRRHSREIRKSEIVAGGIVTPHLQGLGETVRGLAFEGTARELGDGDSEKAYGHYRNRWPQVVDHVQLEDILAGATPMRFYVAEPIRYVFFDEQNFPDQPRQELVLANA